MPCTRELFFIFIFAVILPFMGFIPSLYRRLCDLLNCRRTHQHVRAASHSTLGSIRALLAPPNIPLAQLLKERADANARLAQALGLTNTFVDPDPQVHAEFVRTSRGLLKDVQARGWTRLSETCGEAVRRTLGEYPSDKAPSAGQGVPFDHFVQIVVLRTILVCLLDVGKDVEDIDISSLAFVTSSINELWTLSKSDAPPPSELFQQLHDHLRHLVPSSTSFTNPIDFVVPTWETMWRVCATTIAHIQESEECKTLFHEFLQTEALTTQHFEAAGSQDFSVKDFVEEVMRLHPPSKHISRLRTHESDINPQGDPSNVLERLYAWIRGPSVRTHVVREVADIETVLQTGTIWSHEAHVFNPRRYRTPNPQMKEAQKLVFGYGSLRCIAASWAPVAAGIISATFLEECREGGWEVVPGKRIGGRVGWEGWRVVNRREAA